MVCHQEDVDASSVQVGLSSPAILLATLGSMSPVKRSSATATSSRHSAERAVPSMDGGAASRDRRAA